MKFVVVPMGSAGDVHPMIGVGKLLEGRGHEVVMVVQAELGIRPQLLRPQGRKFCASTPS